MTDYALDKFGERIYPGDYIETGRGDRRRVTGVNGYLVASNIGIHRAEHVRLCGRYHPYHHNGVDKRHPRGKYLTNSEKKGTAMLHIAIRVPEGWSYQDFANSINNLNGDNSAGFPTAGHKVVADVTLSALKERIKARIHHNPEERWLMLSGNTIAESAAPPIAFRQW